MKLLIVEGNPKTIWQARLERGGVPYYQRFSKMLARLGYHDFSVAFPADGENLPTIGQLQNFDGILLTGSSLNVYDGVAEVTRQLDFAAHCFLSGVPIYGSCWGLQVAVVVAGGKISRNEKGREFGLAKDITLTTAGRHSPFFAGKPTQFDAYCIHEDDTSVLPDNVTVLARNEHSEVQSLILNYGKSEFFGVQYHPEFTWDDVAFLANDMQEKFINEGVFTDAASKAAYLEKMKNQIAVNQFDFHTREIANWLTQIRQR